LFWKKWDPNAPLGLIAGQGEFPLLFAQMVGANNYSPLRTHSRIILFGIEGLTDKRIEKYVSEAHYMTLSSLGTLVEFLRKTKVKQVVLGGGLPKKEAHNPAMHLDKTTTEIMSGTADKGDDHLLKAFEVFLKIKCGVSIVDARIFLKDILASKGVMTKMAPSEAEWKDLKFGRRIAKGIGKMDIGQTVVVKRGMILAIEAVEGTDQAIRRGGELGHGGAVVVKVSKPNQDLRFDLPCIGPETLESLKSASGRVLGVEAGKTIMLFKDRLIETANKEGLTIVGL